MYISIDNILKYPAIFIKIGKKLPTNINIACLEKKPEFFIEYFNNVKKLMANSRYEYTECR